MGITGRLPRYINLHKMRTARTSSESLRKEFYENGPINVPCSFERRFTVRRTGENTLKEIFVNLKRFDVPGHLGGICPLNHPKDWIEQVISESIRQGFGKLNGTEVTYLLPESLIISAKQKLLEYPESKTKTLNIGCQGVFREDVAPGENFGTFTTNRPAAAAKTLGCTWVMIGHSEERKDKQQLMGYCCEDPRKVQEAIDHVLNMEVHRAAERDINVLFCVGETAEEQASDMQEESRERVKRILKSQLLGGLSGAKQYIKKIKIAIGYEPVWAIGPGRVIPGKEYISFVTAYIKEVIKETAGIDIPAVYGGGLTEENAKMIASIDTIDGGLIALTTFTMPLAFEPRALKKIIDAYS